MDANFVIIPFVRKQFLLSTLVQLSLGNPFSFSQMVSFINSNRSTFDFIVGDVTNIDFTMGENTVVSDSCAAELNGEIFVFGGSILHSEENPGLKKQVILNFFSDLT